MGDIVQEFYDSINPSDFIIEENILNFEPKSKRCHGLDYDVWFCDNGNWEGNEDETPRVQVYIHDQLIEITISDNPKYYFKDKTLVLDDVDCVFEEVSNLIKENVDDFLYYWNYDNTKNLDVESVVYKFLNI